MARLDRLLHFDLKESLPQYAGKPVRCATTVNAQVVGKLVFSVRSADGFDAKAGSIEENGREVCVLGWSFYRRSARQNSGERL